MAQRVQWLVVFPVAGEFPALNFPTHPAWQLVNPAWTEQDFEASPRTSMKFFVLGLALDSHLTKTIRLEAGRFSLGCRFLRKFMSTRGSNARQNDFFYPT